jgi:hypothetical protein
VIKAFVILSGCGSSDRIRLKAGPPIGAFAADLDSVLG